MGLAFGMSFVLILVSGTSLITADMAAGFLAVLQRRMSAGGPYLGGFAERAATAGALKAGQPFCTALLLALLCTWFLHTSMCMFFQARSDVARMGFAFYGPFAFVIGGTQHVIANVAFLGLPMLLAAFHASAPHSGIGWSFGSHDFLTSLCITALGNLIGGTLFVAMPFWVIAWLQHRAN